MQISPPRISRKPRAETIPLPTQLSNVGATHNPSVTSPAVHASGSYRADSTTLLGSQQSGTIQHVVAEIANFHVSAPEPRSFSSEEISHSQSHPNRELPSFVDEDGILRKQQVPGDGRCGEAALSTVFNVFGIPPITSDKEMNVGELMQRSRENGVHVTCYDVKNFVDRITGIDNTKAFIILRPSLPGFFHYVTIVHLDDKEKDFRESDSYDQEKSKSERYSGDVAQDALLDYETQKNVTACAVLTFREIVSADGPGWMYNKGRALSNRGLWKKAIEAFNEVITCLLEAKEPKQRVLFAKTLYNKGYALYKSRLWTKAGEAFGEVITRFEDATEPALREIVEDARYNKKITLDKQAGE